MPRYPRQVNREYLSQCSGGLNKIDMIDGRTLDLHQDLVSCNRRRRYIVEYQRSTEFQQFDGLHATPPSGSLVSAPIWPRVDACPVTELGEWAAGLAFQ